MSVSDVLTIGGGSVLVIILTEAIKRAVGFSAATTDRFGLALALVLGMVVIEAFNALSVGSAGHLDQASALLVGLLSGATAAGLYGGGTSIASATSSGSGG